VSTRRARAAVEAAFWDLECAGVLGRDTVAPHAALTTAIAKLEPAEGAAATQRAVQLAHARNTRNYDAYAKAHGLAGVVAYRSAKGARFWRIVTESFPRHVNYVYLIEIESDGARDVVLWDCGSGMGRARQMIEDGITIASTHLGAPGIAAIKTLFVSHGHYDHFGDAAWWKQRTNAPLWIHEMDARVLEHFPERTVLTGRDMGIFLRAGGVPDDQARALVHMYLGGKDQYGSVEVDRRIEHGNKLFGDRARVIHTPGHCPGHVCLRVDDVLLVGDQVLSPISPHLSPQALHPQNGLERYLFGLARLGREEGVSQVLPAHYDPIPDLAKRIGEIAAEHVEKLRTTLEVCKAGATMKDVAQTLFPGVDGYNVLLAQLEAGTHVEYLHQLGSLVVTNVDDLADSPTRPAVYKSTAVAVRPLEANAAI
jgi:glyoxylase-like metal-dependent hydrolase (beta-lactamase superfamily II)